LDEGGCSLAGAGTAGGDAGRDAEGHCDLKTTR
jgi:hypothetical protein